MISKSPIKTAIERFLVEPTKEMRISFSKLPEAHKWLMFALLEMERDSMLMHYGNAKAVRAQYDVLCPADVLVAFDTVLKELTEAFVVQHHGINSPIIEWVHPSCRDLTIDELQVFSLYRRRFLQFCTIAGIQLAISVGGGRHGERKTPLLSRPEDWAIFEQRCVELARQKKPILSVLWSSYRLLLDEGQETRAKTLFKVIEAIWPLAIAQLEEGAITLHELEVFYEITPQLGDAASLRGAEACLQLKCSEVIDAVSVEDEVIACATGAIKSFVKWSLLIASRQPELLKTLPLESNYYQAIDVIIMRGIEEINVHYYRGDWDKDTLESESSDLRDLAGIFEEMTKLLGIDEDKTKAIKRCVRHFERESTSIDESIEERFPDDDPSDLTPVQAPSQSERKAKKEEILRLFEDL